MTPVAHRIMRDLASPIAKRSFIDSAEFKPELMADIHCFECSEVVDLACDLVDKMIHDMKEGRHRVKGALAFLPAPNVWLEWKETRESWERQQAIRSRPDLDFDPNERIFVLLRQGTPGYAWLYTKFGDDMIAGGGHGIWLENWNNQIPVASSPKDILNFTGSDHSITDIPDFGIIGYGNVEDNGGIWHATYQTFQIYAFLAMINTPKIISRTQHMPHRGLERRLIGGGLSAGKFPLHAWTEIHLRVTPPQVDMDEHEAHLTGRKALHFCRAHLRVRLGRLEMVRAHWRGDPALGIRQSRYRVEA